MSGNREFWTQASAHHYHGGEGGGCLNLILWLVVVLGLCAVVGIIILAICGG